jgi:hypothetical protein
MPTAKLARNGGAVRLTLSAKAASDIGALERSLKSLAERLGHPNCATGCDTLFLELERDFVVNEELQLNAAPRALGQELSLPQDPVPTRAVRVMIRTR